MRNLRDSLSDISEDLLTLIDRLEECAEDDQALAPKINILIDKLASISEELDEIRES